MRKLTLLIVSLLLSFGAVAQINFNTSSYTVKSVNRGFLYYDSANGDYVTSSSHKSLVDATPDGSGNQQFAFLRTYSTNADECYMYSVEAQKFVTYTGSNGVALELTEEPVCTWKMVANGDYYVITVPGTNNTCINITNWQAKFGCKVIGTGADDGNKMTLGNQNANVDLSAAIAKIYNHEGVVPFSTPEAGKYYKIKGTHSSNPWLTATVEEGGIDVAADEENAAVYLKTANGLKAISTGKYIGTGGNGQQISLVDAEVEVAIEAADYGRSYIKTGGRYLYNNQSDYTREAGNLTATGNAEHPKWGFIEVVFAAKIGDALYATFAEALEATKAMTGDVTVEIYEKVTLNQPLTGSYSSIKFVGNGENAEIYLDVQGYVEAAGKKVAFEDLKLSKVAGGYITNAGFMNLAFGVYGVTEATYTNCTFLNGAYASTGDVTFAGCTFYRSHDRYGLWAYGNVNVTVDGCTFADIRGIKMYAEGQGQEGAAALTVKNTDFSVADGKPAIVLTYGESVTLENNTYNTDKGVFELDLDGAPNGVAVTSDVAPTCVNDNGACGVLVDGKIYTTVAQAAAVATNGSNVTLLHNSAETVEFAYGVIVEKNGFTADKVTVEQPFAAYVVLPEGMNQSNYKTLFGANTVTDGANYYATLQAAVEAVAGQANAVLYCKPGADVGSLQHAPVTSTLTVYGNDANVTGGAERDFDLGNTDPSAGKDITADMTLTVKHLNGCGAWGAKATEHTVNVVFENCANMGKVFITGTTGTLNITMTNCAFEGVIKEAVYSNADGAITLTNVAFSNLNKAVNLNHKAAGTQTVTINGCSFTNCGADVAADQIPVRVLSSVDGGKTVLAVSNSTFTGTPEGGADILIDYGVGLTEATVATTTANVVVENENNVGTKTEASADNSYEFTTAKPVASINGTTYMTLEEAVAAVQAGETITLLADATLAEKLTLPAGITFNGNGKQIIGGEVWADGNLTFAGHTKVQMFNAGYNKPTITIGAGACLELTGTGRMVIGHGATFNITGAIADAKAANVADLTPSLIMAGASFTGAGVKFNVTNAYISVPSSYCSTSKSASGTFDFNITNSIWESTGKLAFEEQSVNAKVDFALVNSVLTTGSHLVFGTASGEEGVVIDNSYVNKDTSRQLENCGTMTIKNGSVVKGAVATSSNAKNPGTVIVENATYAVTGEFSGSDLGTGTIIIKKDAKVSVGSITKANIVIDAAEMTAGELANFTANLAKFAGELSVINNDKLEAKIVDGKIVLVEKPVAMIGETGYATLEAAFKAATSGCTIEILSDVTVTEYWDARYTGSKFTVPVTINGNGNTIKFTNTVYDGGNYMSAFRFEADATVKDLTIDMSEAQSGFAGRIRAISAKGNLTVDGCTFIGNGSANNTRAIIFGEGANVTDLAITITNSTFNGWRRGISDNEAGKDVAANVKITGNTLTDAAVYVSANTAVTFTDNTVAGAYVDIRSYTTDNSLNVTATGNTLEVNTEDKYNNIKAGGNITAQNEFVVPARGSNSPAYTGKDGNGNVRVWGEGGGNAKESFELKLYAGETLVATSTLNNIGGIIDGDVYVTWNFYYPESNDEYWTTIWEEGHPNSAAQPTTLDLVIDGTVVATTAVQMNAADNLYPVKWAELGGVKYICTGLAGEGTMASPYLINRIEDLVWFRDAVNAGNNYAGKHVALTADVDLNSEEWTPIKSFNGVFDGQEKTISNLVINGGSNSNIGFFGQTQNGEIKNLTFNNAKVAGRLNVAVVAGTPYTSKYTNINVTGHVEVNGMAYVGGVGGKNAYADWTDITVDVDADSYVKANSVENGNAYRTYVGGVIGFNGEGSHTFKNISSNIKVIGSTCDVGGIFGIAHYGNNFENITFTGAVEAPADAEEVGGIAGVWHNEKGYTVTFTNCASNGTVTVGDVTTTGSIVGGAYNANNNLEANSGSLIIEGVEAWLPRKVSTKAELDAALAAAEEGDIIVLAADINYGTTQLAINKAITLDLGGYTLTTANAYGGMSIKNNPTIKNGIIVHASNTAAIKVWNATAFEDLVIDVQGKGDANKTIGGIVLQSGSTTRVASIKNVTIKGAALTNGIETYNCGDATENVIGAMENVTIEAQGTGMLISAPCGTATNCSIKGGTNGIEIWIKGNYSASLDLVDSDVEGGVYAHDEFTSNPNAVNNGTLNFSADEATTGAGVEDVTLTIARAENVEGVLEEVIEAAQAKVNDTYYTTLTAAIAAAKAGDVVTVFEGTYAMPSMKAGITIVGEGEVMFEGTLTGTLEDLTMKNIHIKGGNAQRWAYAKGNLVFENVTFEATSVYALHFDGITEGATLLYKDCTIIGWAAMSGSPESCVFDGCTIKGNGSYGLIRTYFNATIENCTFDVANVNTNDNYQDGIHAVSGAIVTVDNCTNVNGAMADIVNIHANSVVVLDGEKIQNIAKVGDAYYATVTEAINAAADGATVELIAGTIDEYIAPWAADSQHASEKSITIVGAADYATTLTGGIYLGYDDNGCREHTITIEGINFTGKGILVAGQQNVVIKDNKFSDITAVVATSQSANANAISVIGKSINATVTGNVIENTASAGINLRDVANATVSGNTISGTENNSITITETAGDGAINVNSNILADWGRSGEGRAIRVAAAKAVTANGNVMSHDAAPEELAKVTKATSLKAVGNYWNGESPEDEEIFNTDVEATLAEMFEYYYTDMEMTQRVDFDPNYLKNYIFDDANSVDYTFTEEKIVGTLTLKRTLIPGIWNPLYLPFAIPVEDLIDNYDIAYYNQMHSVDTNNDGLFDSYTMEVARIKAGTLKANYPYFIRPKTADDCNLEYVAENVTLSPADETKIETSSVANIFTLSGTHKAMDENAIAGCYAVSVEGDWALSAGVKAHRLYLKIEENPESPFASVRAKSIRIVTRGENEGTTGVEEVESVEGENVIYDLSGRRVLEAVKGGIYIVNGKKVLVK